MTTGMYFSILMTICAARVFPRWIVAIVFLVNLVLAVRAGWLS